MSPYNALYKEFEFKSGVKTADVSPLVAHVTPKTSSIGEPPSAHGEIIANDDVGYLTPSDCQKPLKKVSVPSGSISKLHHLHRYKKSYNI